MQEVVATNIPGHKSSPKIALIILILWCLGGLTVANAQEQSPRKLNLAPVKKWYGMSGFQLIFSEGSVQDNGSNLSNTVRFTCFFHIQQQFHYDFGKAFGLYTGFSIINVGFINSVPLPDGTSATLKQRSYSLGIPLGFKLGNMPKGNYLAVGAEGECMFAYKEKILYEGNKTKLYDPLFSSQDVNLFNPSLFAEVRFHKGGYIRFKYYLFNFLVDKTTVLNIGDYAVNYTPEKSALYYVSLGVLLKTKHKHHLNKNDV